MSRRRRGGAGTRQRARGRCRRAAIGRFLLGLVGLLLVVAGAGCDAAARRRIVDALFDDPPSKRRARAAEEQQRAASAPTSETRRRKVRQPKWQGSQHGPFAARLCQACHVPASGANPAPGAEVARLRRRVEQLCVGCHEPATLRAGLVWGERTRWHGPVRAGLCTACHLPHRSRQPRLLRVDRAQVCTGCHESGHLTAPEPPQGATCLDCHDPHAPQMAGLDR